MRLQIKAHSNTFMITMNLGMSNQLFSLGLKHSNLHMEMYILMRIRLKRKMMWCVLVDIEYVINKYSIKVRE